MTAVGRLKAEATRRILIKDGAYGTAIQAYGLQEACYRGDLDLNRDQKGNNDLLCLTKPDVVREIAQAYVEAGADVLGTNSFNANRISQADYGAEDLVPEMNVAAARIIREVADRASDADGRPRWVAGAIGPTNKTLSLSPRVEDPGYREVDWDTVAETYREQAEALLEGGADLILVETVFDTLNAKAAIWGVRQLGGDVPLMLSMTLTDLSGRNLSGHSVEAFWASVRHAEPVSVGLNCSFGADQLRPHVATLAGIADTLIMAYPNAGLPNDLGAYDEPAEVTAAHIRDWADGGTVNIVGGCCGTTPAHIRAIADTVAGLPPRMPAPTPKRTLLAGLDPMRLAA